MGVAEHPQYQSLMSDHLNKNLTDPKHQSHALIAFASNNEDNICKHWGIPSHHLMFLFVIIVINGWKRSEWHCKKIIWRHKQGVGGGGGAGVVTPKDTLMADSSCFAGDYFITVTIMYWDEPQEKEFGLLTLTRRALTRVQVEHFYHSWLQYAVYSEILL